MVYSFWRKDFSSVFHPFFVDMEALKSVDVVRKNIDYEMEEWRQFLVDEVNNFSFVSESFSSYF